MLNTDVTPTAEDNGHAYALVERVLLYLAEHALEQPSLETLAVVAGVSPFHLQRVFTRWAGVSPKRYIQFLSKEHALRALREGATLCASANAAGLSGTGRLHDLLVHAEALTPGQARTRGAGVLLKHGVGPTPFGDAFIAWSARGVVHLEFQATGAPWLPALSSLSAKWPAAQHEEDAPGAAALLDRIFETSATAGLALDVQGTNFQLKVWEAVLRVPSGHCVSYGQLAAMAGSPGAQRAVGTALGANTLAYLIPCHRVIRESAETGQYRWGTQRKLAMLAWEASRRHG